MEERHEHKFVFLRQERKNVGYERNPTWLYEDVFYCESCLAYQRVKVKKTQPDPRSFGAETEVYE